MSSQAIIVDRISKKFRVGTGAGVGYHRLSEMLTGLPKFAWQTAMGWTATERQSVGKGSHTSKDVLEKGEFWALKDVSFEISAGEVVGIIGRNGAGKSTLLKTLSRITEPTSGRFGVRGRVASLLEVGTGFHPELTGRENIFVSGITLGMTRDEIRKRFDEIVAFSGVERFLETPVKRYSSGMQVRLGFAVAAHLESEILLVDEVLAVGDSAFQQQCFERIRELTTSDERTVLLVSHNLDSVKRLATSVLWLDEGSVAASGQEVSRHVNDYLNHATSSATTSLADRTQRRGNGTARFVEVSVKDADGQRIESVACGSEAILSLVVEASRTVHADLCVGIHTADGFPLAHLSSVYTDNRPFDLPQGRSTIDFVIRNLPLVPGRYDLTLFVSEDDVVCDWVTSAHQLEVGFADHYGTGVLPTANHGTLVLDYRIEPKTST